MRIHVGQIYVEPGVAFPFTHVFQKHIGDLLTNAAVQKDAFSDRFGSDYDLIFNLSAKKCLVSPEVKGPAVFKRHKTVEYTIFLPGFLNAVHDKESLAAVICQLLKAISAILGDLGMSASAAENDASNIALDIVNAPGMVRQS